MRVLTAAVATLPLVSAACTTKAEFDTVASGVIAACGGAAMTAESVCLPACATAVGAGVAECGPGYLGGLSEAERETALAPIEQIDTDACSESASAACTTKAEFDTVASGIIAACGGAAMTAESVCLPACATALVAGTGECAAGYLSGLSEAEQATATAPFGQIDTDACSESAAEPVPPAPTDCGVDRIMHLAGACGVTPIPLSIKVDGLCDGNTLSARCLPVYAAAAAECTADLKDSPYEGLVTGLATVCGTDKCATDVEQAFQNAQVKDLCFIDADGKPEFTKTCADGALNVLCSAAIEAVGKACAEVPAAAAVAAATAGALKSYDCKTAPEPEPEKDVKLDKSGATSTNAVTGYGVLAGMATMLFAKVF